VEDLPSWLTPLPDAETMRGVDRWAIEEEGVDSLELMERAGAAVAAAVERLAPDGSVAVVCGKGNNGGDGLVVARLLREAGREVAVVCATSPAELKGDAQKNLARLPGSEPISLDGRPWGEVGGQEAATRPGLGGAPLRGRAAIVDALLGTGFQGEPHGEIAAAIVAINDAAAPVVSVDVPSGVDASTGAIAGDAVRAATTVSFHAAKPGLWIRPGKARAGAVEVAAIGIPRGAPMQAGAGLIDAALLARLPRRGGASTKFVSGHVLVAGGSLGLTGAPAMAARAAMRAGAGYVTAFVPAGLQQILASGATPELMTRGLPEADGALADAGVEQVLEATARGGALALGPGLGREDPAVGFARRLARAARVPMVIDADGLNAHAGRLQELTSRSAPTVLTPHAGELGRLLELDSAEVESERLRYVREAARRAQAIVVLKGDDTLIAEPGGQVAVSRGGSPALATAGTGDVLTGVIAALLAQGLEPFMAAAAGVLLHARAGRLAAIAVGAAESVIASDVIEALARARGGEDHRPGGIGVG
jgi:NAD(P)H-hydrate epimerase